jgi:NADH-quinone oxidoreductase subunit M
MGGYGFLRFSLPMFPDASAYFAPVIFVLSAIAVIYASLVALAQSDMKKLIAYSSVAHMGFVTIGIFTLTEQGIDGAMFQMISHGLVSAALFFCVGVVYDRLHTREIDAYGGVVDAMPRYAVFFMFMMLASVGLPGTSGFVGEMLVLVGAWKAAPWVAVFAATGLVLGACYMLWLYRRVVFGKAEKSEVLEMPPLDSREIAIFVPLSLLVLWFGVYPSTLLDIMDASVSTLLSQLNSGSFLSASLR